MTTLKVEQLGDELVVRLTSEAQRILGVRAGDAVVVGRSLSGEISLAAPELDHLLRLERSRAFMRRYRDLI